MKWKRIDESDVDKRYNGVILYSEPYCDNDGDVNYECEQLTKGGFAEIEDIDYPSGGGDGTFRPTIFFKVLDITGFEKATGFSVYDFPVKDWDY